MSEDIAKLVRQIEERSKQIRSFADYSSSYRSSLMPFEVSGRMHFLRPDRVRSESMVNGKAIISIRNGSIIRRYSPIGNQVWQYELKRTTFVFAAKLWSG